MTRGILIAGNESPLFSAIASEAAKRVEAFVSVSIPNRFPQREGGSKTETVKGAIPLPWNPFSSISARTLVLAAENRLRQINDAILVCTPPAVFGTADGLEPEEIEILVDDHIRGWFFLTRELVLGFRRLGSGALSFVAPEISHGGKNTQADLLGLPAAACFATFARGILASHANDPFQIMGFSGYEAADKNEFAAWLFKIMDEGSGKNSGRWHKYSKLSLFR